MKLLLARNADGTGFVINVVGALRTLSIPLAEGLSTEIEKMLRQENIPTASLILPPHAAPRRQ